MKKVLVLTGGGDCPGLNAVIRGICKRAQQEADYEIHGSIEAFNGVFRDPPEIIHLTNKEIAGIHVKGGTILKTTNKNSPLNYPTPDGLVDRSEELINRIRDLGFMAVINIGGDGSQRISKALFDKGLPIIGVPKTIDNDLSATDMTFGFQTAVQVATDCFDKLVTTAESHNRTMIMEVMGRDAGWIALHTAIAGGAEACLIPEIPYDINKVKAHLEKRYHNGRGFTNVVIAEGARPKDGMVYSHSAERGSENVRLGGVAYQFSAQLKASGYKPEIRETVLGHIQRGGTPLGADRVLALMFGVKAFELVHQQQFGRMVSFRNRVFTSVTLEESTKTYHRVDRNDFMIHAAKGLGITFGDD
jgi:ATP-dependent phosphofructokinase / diphosphate-dependent phosphofructokinase